jgi:hypothetical protein
MSNFIRSLLVFFVLSNTAHGSVLCLSAPESSTGIFDSEILRFSILDSTGTTLLSAQGRVSNTDSAPFGHVAKTYAQDNGAVVTSIHYLYGRPFEIADPANGKELKLSFDQETSALQGADCYKIGP